MRAALTRRMKLLEESTEVNTSEVQSTLGIYKDKNNLLEKDCNKDRN